MSDEALMAFAKSFHAMLIDPDAVTERDAAGFGAEPLTHQSAIMHVLIEVLRRKNAEQLVNTHQKDQT